MNKIISRFLISAPAGIPAVFATGNYGYESAYTATTISGYTYADPDSCSVTITGTCLSNNGGSLAYPTASGTKDPVTKQATAYKSLPSGFQYYTRVEGTHKVGKNTYYTAHP